MSHPDWSKVDKNGPNTYTRPNGHRDCRTCIRDRARRYSQRRRAAA